MIFHKESTSTKQLRGVRKDNSALCYDPILNATLLSFADKVRYRINFVVDIAFSSIELR